MNWDVEVPLLGPSAKLRDRGACGGRRWRKRPDQVFQFILPATVRSAAYEMHTNESLNRPYADVGVA